MLDFLLPSAGSEHGKHRARSLANITAQHLGIVEPSESTEPL